MFNLPVNEAFTLVDEGDESSSQATAPQYKLVLDKFEVLHGTKPIRGTYEWKRARNDVVAFNAHDILPRRARADRGGPGEVSRESQRTLVYGNLATARKVTEENNATTFTTEPEPKDIRPQNVVYTYPVDRQMHFLPKEYDGGGYLQLKQGSRQPLHR